jgi:hypothetical protein
MPCIRIEWLPVHLFGLGRFGFDHLQLVYQPAAAGSQQDDWYVMEGVREVAHDGTFPGIEGADGRTTLSVANLAAREDLVAKIGTPEVRGSRCLAYESGALGAWETMSSYARDIEQQDYPYIAHGLPRSPTPTINSSSAIASLIYYSGLDPSDRLAHLINDDVDAPTIRSATDHTLTGGERNLELVGGAVRGEGNGLANRILGNEADNVLLGRGGDDVLYGGPGNDTLIGGAGSDSYVYLDGDGNDVILDEAAPGEIDQLVLAGGIVPREVSLYRPSAHPDDLLLALARGGHILIKGFLAAPSAGIERVVFDHDAAWERAEIERLAQAAPLLDDRLTFRPELTGATLPPTLNADGGRGDLAAEHRVEPFPEWNDVVPGLDAHAAAAPPPSADPSPDAALHALF